MYKHRKEAIWCATNSQGIVWNSWCLESSEIPSILLGAVKSENVAKGTQKCRLFGIFLDKEEENLDGHDWYTVRDLIDEEMLICLSYSFRHKTTLNCADHQATLPWLLNNAAFEVVNFVFSKCFVSIEVFISFECFHFFPIFTLEILSVQARWSIKKRVLT